MSFTSHSRRRGITIPELLISMGLSAIVLLSTHQLVSKTVDFFHQSNRALSVQREALVAISKINDSLTKSHRNRMNAGTSPKGFISFPSIYDRNRSFQIDKDGRLFWQSSEAYFQGVDENGVNVIYNPRREYGARLVSPPDLDSVGFGVDTFFEIPERIIARHVEVFEPTLTTNGVKVRLVIALAVRGQSRMTLESKVLPRN